LQKKIIQVFKILAVDNRLDSNIFNKGNKKDKVKNIEFVDKIKGSLLFKVEYKNGES
jgi:hypothetical protein